MSLAVNRGLTLSAGIHVDERPDLLRAGLRTLLMPPASFLALTGSSPGLSGTTGTLSPGSAALSIEGATPAVALDRPRSPAQADLSVSASAPTVEIDLPLVPDQAALALTGSTPSVAFS